LRRDAETRFYQRHNFHTTGVNAFKSQTGRLKHAQTCLYYDQVAWQCNHSGNFIVTSCTRQVCLHCLSSRRPTPSDTKQILGDSNLGGGTTPNCHMRISASALILLLWFRLWEQDDCHSPLNDSKRTPKLAQTLNICSNRLLKRAKSEPHIYN